ncbi:9035_t:CDS:1 [Acaulospora morrowiae]|uniref:9035_t:CDS:1 n=1 Tax=Acaulospora morrowiae TaxID=94023 RepID=A0A9N8W960_9GLOM|nr:9035_t:CDS:1 [Acaulospora morrowiae]
MTISSLPPENLRDIFEYVIQKTDKGTNLAFLLYNCLLVNRTWCRNVVSVLWGRPFHLLNRASPELISVYVSGFSEDAKGEIKRYGIDFSDLLSGPLTFDYTSMLRELDHELVYASVSQWVSRNELGHVERERNVDGEDNESDEEYFSIQSNIEFEKNRRVLSITQGICKQFFSSCGPLKSLNLSRRMFPTIPNDYLLIVDLPGAREAFSQLDEFTINTRDMNRDILPKILECCDSIRTLDIYSLPFSEIATESRRSSSLSNFISRQRGLRRITLSIEIYNDNSIDYSSRYKLLPVISSLKNHLNSLNWVKFQFIKNFMNVEDIIESVLNVETLLFCGCTLPSGPRKPSSPKFSRLRRLSLWNTTVSLDAISTIIASCQGTLKEIQLRGRFDITNSEEEIRSRLMSMLGYCSKLERLQLYTAWMCLGSSYEILQELGETLPTSFLHLEIDLICDPAGLQAFFEKCTLKSLTLGIGTVDTKGMGMNDENLEVIREYVTKKGSLEKLVLVGSDITATDQGLEATRKLIKVDRVICCVFEMWE